VSDHAPETARELAAITDQARLLIQQGSFQHAEQLLSNALSDTAPARGQGDALYTLAVARRYLGQLEPALEALDELLSQDPTYGRAWQERGHCLKARGEPDSARAAYERAVRLNPALPSSWDNLAGLCHAAGLHEQSKTARRERDALRALPRELLSVTSMFHEGRYYKADRLCRHFLRQHPHHIEAMRLLALIGSELGILTDAEFLLESCLELDPNNDRVRYDYANLLLKMQKFEKAYRETRQLAKEQPGNLAFLALLANAAAGVGHHEEAIERYNQVLRQSPHQTMLYVMRGHAHKTIGELEQAVHSYRRASQLKPDYGDAYWSLANTKTYRFNEREIREMAKQETSGGIDREDRIHLCFALGKALEDRGEYERSFHYYDRGNALKHDAVGQGHAKLIARTRAQTEVCDAAFFESREGVGCRDSGPIFIVGMPRAGSTLLEQILASHSRVVGTYELPHIIALAHRLRGSRRGESDAGADARYPEILTELEHDYFRRFGEQYLEQTRIYREGYAYFIDKNPNNFFHVGLIRLILPNARVIDARRHPMACCFSGFKQLFGQGQEFSYGLESIGHYYRRYVELMDHWERVLPGFTLRVQYEDVVADVEAEVRRMLDFCGLPFEDACLEFHKTERSVRTPSSEQVRQPIYQSGLEQWRHYEPWLGPLKAALGAEVRERYAID
jgi:tetratricopeptide (TPR) repeat protein